jgi:hypothetical protein
LLARVSIAQDLEANELVDILRGESGLVKLHAKLLHPYRSDADHSGFPSGPHQAAKESCEL